jgi:CRP-like cAMP-binding protein
MLNLSPERLNVLQERVLLFEGFSGEEVMELLQHAKKRTIGDTEVIVDEGIEAQSMFILISGQALVTREHGGQTEVLAVLEPGATVGEMAMVDAAPRSAKVSARGTAVVLEFESSALVRTGHALLQKVYRNLSIILARRLRAANRRMEAIAARGSAVAMTEGQVKQMDLSGMDLTGARAKRTKFIGADLRGADLRDADLRGADLRGSRLDGADLRETEVMTARTRDHSLPPKQEDAPPEETEHHWETLMKSLAQRAKGGSSEDE